MSGYGKVSWCGVTASGSRKERNEDSWMAFAADGKGSQILGCEGMATLREKDVIIAVSDGMGGGNAGDLASSLLLKRMGEIIPETFKAAAAGFFPDHLTRLQSVVKRVHEDINDAARDSREAEGMAATVALAWFTPENMYLANAGDSRIYVCRDGGIEQVSKDHTAAWGSWKRGEMREAEYRAHPRRAALYEIVGGGHQRVAPHFAAVKCREGDRILICSDGLTDGLWERKIRIALASSDKCGAVAGELVRLAVGSAGDDDTTAVVIDLEA